ncbi:EAL domain-containing protein [Deinococcus oregonensis]|uniref:EAL domain-containing protein n=1 Tax=Deinococcus oregonensis TaxID=1805970 RepID=A0ABV6B947_9DEIO
MAARFRFLGAPSAFIPAAEDSGLIVDIGIWVLDEACATLAVWNRLGVHARLAVNVSPVQFARTDFVTSLREALERHRVDPGQLELERTERVVIRDVAFTSRQFGELRRLGVCLTLDDFGSGEAHLGTLLHLPFDTLKLDKSLIHPLERTEAAERVVRAMCLLAHALGLEVVAEGIETAEQFAAVRALGCDRAQGYLLGHPSPQPLEDTQFQEDS